MCRCHHKNEHNNSQDKMPPLEPSYPTPVGPKYSNIGEAQEKYLKVNYVKMIEVLKEKINKSLKESRENTNKP